MAGHQNLADLLLPLDESSDTPLNRQVYRGLRDAILRADLAPGTRLPSSRRLARYLAVSRTTVLAAYDQLVAEALVIGTVGCRSILCSLWPRCAPKASAMTPARLTIDPF